MSPERWKQVESVFEQALALPAGERPAFFQSSCGGDEELRREVELLLDSHGQAGNLLERQSLFFTTAANGEEGSLLSPGERIGRYRIVREIGRGGMGAVYLAERADEQYEKRVALKLIKRGMDTDSVLRQFRNERQILASFDHPNIARLFDADSTESGLPFFVMEYVEGLPIDKYCEAHALSVTERLRLFREVCAAVSYAHRHTVIHRDIKPSNILVTSEGAPKLLDFGIAKLVQQSEDGAESAATMTGLRAMTPQYASPEQMRGGHVTTSSDVYSLGVVLYELLTGVLPYRFASPSPHDMDRAISDTAPKKPSTVVASDRGQKSEIRNQKSLRGDVDNILLMALRKEPERRYLSVEQFSEDIRRHLEARPVAARKDTLRYRAGKFMQRNRAASIAAAMVLLSLLGGIIATSSAAHRARVQEAVAQEAEARAERRFNDVRKLAHSVLFDYHDAIKDLPGATRVRERLVKDGLAYLDSLASESQGDPALQRELAAAYDRVGDVRGQAYSSASLGDRAGAEDSYLRALRIREALVAANPRDVENRRDLAGNYRKLGTLLGEGSEQARGLNYLNQSLTLYSELATETPINLQIQQQLADIHNSIGSALEDRNDMPGALKHHRAALTIREKAAGKTPDDRTNRRNLSVSYENIGRVLALSNDVPEALNNNGKSMALREKLLAEEPLNADYRRIVAVSYQNDGDYRSLQNDPAGALASFRKKLALDEQSYAVDSANAAARLDLGYSCQRIGELLAQTGDGPAALPFYKRALQMYEENMRADPKDMFVALSGAAVAGHLGEGLARLGQIAAAREECDKAVKWLEAIADDQADINQQRLRLLAYAGLGDADVALAEADKAEPDRRAAHDNYQRVLSIVQELRHRGIANADDLARSEEAARKAAECRKVLQEGK